MRKWLWGLFAALPLAVSAQVTWLNANQLSPPAGSPYAQVYLTNTQTVSNTTLTKVAFDTLSTDPNGWCDVTTNHRCTPKVAGKYLVGVQLSMQGALAGTARVDAYIYKNGASVAAATNLQYAQGNYYPQAVSYVVSLNGTTDYVEAWCYFNTTGTDTVQGGATVTYMYMTWLGP
jgi:hypothetical protein